MSVVEQKLNNQCVKRMRKSKTCASHLPVLHTNKKLFIHNKINNHDVFIYVHTHTNTHRTSCVCVFPFK